MVVVGLCANLLPLRACMVTKRKDWGKTQSLDSQLGVHWFMGTVGINQKAGRLSTPNKFSVEQIFQSIAAVALWVHPKVGGGTSQALAERG